MLPVTNICAKSSSPNVLYCEDCNINFNSQSQLMQHLMSPKHINRVNRAQKQQTAGQFRGGARGAGRGQARGRGGMYVYTATCLLFFMLVFILLFLCIVINSRGDYIVVILTVMMVR